MQLFTVVEWLCLGLSLVGGDKEWLIAENIVDNWGDGEGEDSKTAIA